MLNKLMNLVREEEGQGMAEYGLILAGVAVVAVAAFFVLGERIDSLIRSVVSSFTKTTGTGAEG
ncbi:Flp family type IVb pilin [Bacillus timonensis]|nr:Flp family type IVb pilin [Bacillus timonensis]